MPAALRGPFLEAVEGGRIRSMQNKLMPAAPLHRPGALLLGDAFNMRHPLTGETPFFMRLSEMVGAACKHPGSGSGDGE